MQAIAVASTCHSRNREATSGSITRTKVAETANEPRIAPITEALKPNWCPITGTMKVCTSQQEASTMLISIRRRNSGSLSKSQARLGGPSTTVGSLGNSLVLRTHSQVIKGNIAINKKAPRKPLVSAAWPPSHTPAWSINKPAASGPTKFDTAGPVDSQLKTFLSSVGLAAARPTWRCKLIDTAPTAPPVNVAVTHNTPNTGQTTASAQPKLAMATAMPTGRLSPCRST